VDQGLLREWLAGRREPAFRARRVWEWAARGVTGYDEMTNLPVRLRRALGDEVPFSTLELVHDAESRAFAGTSPPRRSSTRRSTSGGWTT
jgi:adenine C2-methylase RlmN of 23S rRNA A2503 and tRNA A37